ncbi:MAG: asparagine synthetase B, partial [Bacteroidetes bacterium]|nr:asparagine synthetase B [Bacteroidota bacterium]
MKTLITLILFPLVLFGQQKILIPMDLKQTNHLKAYGIAFWTLEKGIEIDWLLNYRGGSFMVDNIAGVANECRIRGVAFEQISGGNATQILGEIAGEDNNMDVVRLEKAPKVAV